MEFIAFGDWKQFTAVIMNLDGRLVSGKHYYA
jgi:hypothetical protein